LIRAMHIYETQMQYGPQVLRQGSREIKTLAGTARLNDLFIQNKNLICKNDRYAVQSPSKIPPLIIFRFLDPRSRNPRIARVSISKRSRRIFGLSTEVILISKISNGLEITSQIVDNLILRSVFLSWRYLDSSVESIRALRGKAFHEATNVQTIGNY